MKIRRVKIDELKEAPYNPRKITKKELEKLKRSIQEFGFVEPLVWNRRTGHVVGGNQRLKVLKELGYEEVEVVEVDLDLEHEKVLNLALNRIQSEWDLEKLEEVLRDLENDLLNLTGFDEAEIDELLNDLVPTEYTLKIPTPVYEPTGAPVYLSELYDDSRYNELMEEIEEKDIPQDLKEFLKLAAARFVEFRFDKIAEYYAQAPEEVKRLFEKLALVIVDFNKAIEYGFVELVKELKALWEEWRDE